MKVLGIAFLTVLGAATLTVNAHNVDMAKRVEILMPVIQMCRKVATTMVSEGLNSQCEKENLKNITSECFPEMKGETGSCIMKCLNPDVNQEASSPAKFVESLMTKERRTCIREIMKECMDAKTGFTIP